MAGGGRGLGLATITALWRRFKPQGDNEAQTEADWIRPVLEALGHRYNVQVALQTPLGTKVPDYVFCPDEATRQAAKRGGRPGRCRAPWPWPTPRRGTGRWIAAAGKAVSTLHENPSLQIDYYIRHSGLAWGILTNGRLWRLYHKDTSKKLDVYYEVDLPALIEQGDAEAFMYFWLFFRREAFRARQRRPLPRQPGSTWCWPRARPTHRGQREAQGAGLRRAAPPGPGLPGFPRQRPAAHRRDAASRSTTTA